MRKRQLTILISALVIAGILLTTLLATGVIPLGGYNATSSDADKNEDAEKEESGNDLDQPIDSANESQKSVENKVDILNNSPEYDIRMYSYFDNDKLLMEVEYYLDGVSRSRLFQQNDFPEFENIMGNDAARSSNDKSAIIKLSNAILNTKYAKIYFSIEKELQVGEKAFSIYALSLKDETIKFLYQGEGNNLNTPIFSPDKEYIAFNHLLDEKGNNSLIHIFYSNDDTSLVVDNKTKNGDLIGTQTDKDKQDKEGKTFSYYIIRWKTLEDLKLREYSYVFDKSENFIRNEQNYDISYNILENIIIYPEEKYAQENVNSEVEEKIDVETAKASTGDESKSSEMGAETSTETSAETSVETSTSASTDTNTDINTNAGINMGTSTSSGTGTNDGLNTNSEAVTTLKNFYKYVTEVNYEKAYDLFDDNFQSESKMFMGLKISKAEITLEVFTAFAEATEIFKNVKIEKIMKEEQNDDSFKIYYTQSIVIDPNKEPQVYPLIVTLKKITGAWKIMAVEDGTPGKEPFSIS